MSNENQAKEKDMKLLDLMVRGKILNNHSIESWLSNGRLMALSYYTKDGVAYPDLWDVTDWTRRELYDWLGY